jgi:hypothetical protein
MLLYLDMRSSTDVLEEYTASDFRDKDLLSKQQAPHLCIHSVRKVTDVTD